MTLRQLHNGWRTLCFKEHFTQKNHFALFASNWLVTVCYLTHFIPQHTFTLPPEMFFSLEHFGPQPPLPPRNTLLLRTFYSLAYFAPWNTLLPQIFAMPWLTYIPNIQQRIKIFYSKVGLRVLFHIPISHHGQMNSKDHNVLRSKLFQGDKGVEKDSVLRNKVFWEVKSVEEEGVMRSKGFWVAKGVKEQGVLRSKLWLCHVCLAAKCVKLLRSKVFLLSNVFFFEAKCASAYRYGQWWGKWAWLAVLFSW